MAQVSCPPISHKPLTLVLCPCSPGTSWRGARDSLSLRGWGPFKPLPSQVSGPLPTGTTPPALSCQGLRAHPRSVLSSSREYHVQGERSHREGLALTFPLGPPPGQMPWMLTRTGGRRQESVCWAHADTTRTVSCSTHQPPGSTGTPSACISDHVVFFRTRYFCIKRKG